MCYRPLRFLKLSRCFDTDQNMNVKNPDKLMAYRHSEGAYLAGRVPTVIVVRPRSVAVAKLVVEHAQSIEPAKFVRAAFWTFGVKRMVLLKASAGNPEVADVAVVTSTTPVAAFMVILLTNLDCFSASGFSK
jgi:hypothetical protein